MSQRIKIPWFHKVGNIAMRAIFPLVLKLDIKGWENIPKTGPVIAVVNHTVFLDSILVTSYVRPDVLPMAKAEIFRGPFAPIFTGYGAFPVRRGEGDLAAIRRALQLLKENHVLLMSPEGTRSKSGVMEEAHEGVALLAYRSGAPILPVAMWGGKVIWQRLKHLKRTPIGYRIGEPLKVVPLQSKPTRAELRAITDEVMYYLASMLPPEYRGRYADVDRFTPRYVLPVRELDRPRAKEPQGEVMAYSN